MGVSLFRRVSVYGVLVALVVLGGACAAGGKQVVRPAYREKVPGRVTLGLLPLGTDLLPSPTPVQVPPMTRRGLDLYYRLFGLLLSDMALLTVLEAGPSFDAGEATFERRRLALAPGDSVEVPVPVGAVRVEGRFPSFLLVLDDLSVTYGTEEGREALGALPTSRLVLSARCTYMIWDNQASRLVGFGRLMETAPTEPGANVRAPITVLLRRLAAAIIKKSPFLFNEEPMAGG